MGRSCVKVFRQYKFVVEDRDRHGNVRVYLRRPGQPKIRMTAEPGTPDFDAEYRRAIAGEIAPKAPRRPPPPAPGSLRAICVSYFGSLDYRALDPRTRRVRRQILEHLCDEHGDKPAALLEPRHVRALRDAKAATPEAANGLLKSLRAVFRFGTEAGLTARNPAREVRYLAGKPGGFRAWSLEDVRQFEDHHSIGTPARLALALLLYTGQRRADVVAMGPALVRDGWLTLTQTKNARRRPVTLSIPIVPALAEAISATQCGDSTFLVHARGKPFTPGGFGNWFRKRCDEAGLPLCSAHGLRKAAASRLAEHGCSAHEIAAVTGHRSLKEVQRYTASADQRRMAGNALARLATVVSHPNVAASGWDKDGSQPIENKETTTCMASGGGTTSAGDAELQMIQIHGSGDGDLAELIAFTDTVKERDPVAALL